jgi:TonB family protein
VRRALAPAVLALAACLGAGAARAADVSVAAIEIVDAFPSAPSVEARLAEIRRRIQSALRYPPSARRRGLEGMARLQFEIGADGRADRIELVRSSGHPLLDRAARESVVAAGVLPRVYGRLQVPVHFGLGSDDLHH